MSLPKSSVLRAAQLGLSLVAPACSPGELFLGKLVSVYQLCTKGHANTIARFTALTGEGLQNQGQSCKRVCTHERSHTHCLKATVSLQREV